jgi:hypothetical protein
MERVTLSRKDAETFDFSEKALADIDGLNLLHRVHFTVRDAATDAFIASVDDLRFKYSRSFEDAFAHAQRTQPRLFKLCRLRPTAEADADVCGDDMP